MRASTAWRRPWSRSWASDPDAASTRATAHGRPATGHRRGADDAAGRLVEAVQPDQEQVGEVDREGRGAGEALHPAELLDEERVAVGPRDDRPDLLVGERVGVQGVDQRPDRRLRQGTDLEAVEGRQPGPLGQGRPQGVPAVDVVAAVGHDERDGRLELAGEEVAEQLAGGLVGPVGVLDDDEQGLLPAGLLEQGVDAREEVGAARPVVAAGCPLGGIGAVGGSLGDPHPLAGQQPDDGRVRLGDGVDDGRELVLEPPQDLGERQVREGAVAEVEAVPDDDEASGGDGTVAQRQEQPGLADSGVPSDEYRRAALGVVDRGEGHQVGEELVAADQGRASVHRRHEVHHRACHGQSGHRRGQRRTPRRLLDGGRGVRGLLLLFGVFGLADCAVGMRRGGREGHRAQRPKAGRSTGRCPSTGRDVSSASGPAGWWRRCDQPR
jgi:hypothetical protein